MPWTLEDYPISLANFTRPVRQKAIEIANTLVEEARHDEAKAIAIATTSAKQWARNRGITIRTDDLDPNVKAPALHVVPVGEDWAVRRESDSHPIARFTHYPEARQHARDLATEANTDLVLHRADGTISDRESRRRLHDDHIAWHVTPAADGWDVRREGTDKVHRHCNTKRDALAIAREVARNQHGRLVIHRADGEVQQEHAYSTRPARH